MSSIEFIPGLAGRPALARDTARLARSAGKVALTVLALGLIVIVPMALRTWFALGHFH